MAGKTPAQPKLRLEWVRAGELQDHPRNWRRHPAGQLKALESVLADRSIGWAGACLFNERTGHLIDGHARRDVVGPDALVPVLVGRWSPKAERKILATLDPLAMLVEADREMLGTLLGEVDLAGEAFEDLGALLEGLRGDPGDLQDGHTDPDSVPEPPDEPITRRGDLWSLGDHRLLCGDGSTAKDAAKKDTTDSPRVRGWVGGASQGDADEDGQPPRAGMGRGLSRAAARGCWTAPACGDGSLKAENSVQKQSDSPRVRGWVGCGQPPAGAGGGQPPRAGMGRYGWATAALVAWTAPACGDGSD